MDGLAQLLGESPAINLVREKLRQLLERQPVGRRLPAMLIQGETGTGKGLIARLVHGMGPRRGGPFVDINCPAIPEPLLEAELFGFERGAFTDAHRAKPGLFQSAHGGTLFLDEVGLLPESVQAKLLSAIEDRIVRRLGSTRPESVDVCIISATNSDLRVALRERRFREDLYHRLAVITLDLPALRDRERDVLLLAERFLARACADYGLPPKWLEAQAQSRLLAYAWPGNIRELGNVIERAALFAESPVITGAMLGPLQVEGPSLVAPATSAIAIAMTPEEAMRQHLVAVLEQSEGNISHAAARLGIARNTLYARLEKYGVRGHRAVQTRPRRTSRPETVSAPVSAATHVHWEHRGITLLSATFVEPDGIDARSLTSRALDIVIDKLQTFGGRIEELTPTGILASFGVDPVDDAPRRAAHAALVIHKGAARAGDSASRAPGVKIALHAAKVLVGRSETRVDIDADAKGGLRAILDQLLQTIETDETVASAAAAPFLERRFELVPIDDGAGSADRPYRLTGQERRGLGLWGTMTQFVGRRDEIEVLCSRLAAAGSGHGQFVAIVGEPGVGKSRLIWEFTRSSHVDGCLVLEAGAVPYGKTTSYLPAIDLLKGYFKIQDRNDLREIREKVTGKLLTLDESLKPTLPALLALLDVPVDNTAWRTLDPAERRRRTLDAVKRLLLREAREQPLLLIFEDLHWIDGETQALLDGLVESLGSARLLLLVNYRPEYQHAWGAKTSYSQMRLDALPAEPAGELLDALLGRDPGLAPLKQLLVKRGNPFFLEETVRTLVETKVLAGERGRYRLAHPVQAIQVPATVHAMLAARIDRLPPEDKRLLQVASVIGKDVPFALLEAIAGLPDEALRRGLDHLQAAEFLYETWLVPDLEYSFKHALTHEVAYGSLLQERRRAHHASIMHAMERLYAERVPEHIERLAYHAVRGEVWEKALHYGRQVGVRGVERRAYRESIAGYEQALDALNHLSEAPGTAALAVELRRALARVLTFLGDFQRSLTVLAEAEALARQLADRASLGRVLGFASFVRGRLGDFEGAIAASQEALEIATTLGDPVEKAHALYRLGQMANRIGDFDRAAGLFRANVEAISLGEPGPSRDLAIISRAWLARVTSSIGEFAEGRRHGEEALRVAIEDGRGIAPIIAYGCLSELYLAQGDLDAAIRVLEPGLALCHAAEEGVWSGFMAGNLGEAYGRAGRFAESLPLLEEALSALHTGGLFLQAVPTRQLSTVYLLAGRFDEAWQHACQALDLARQQKTRGIEAAALFQLGAVHTHASPPDFLRAEMRYQEALALAEPRGMRPLVAHCHLGLGTLYRRTGKRQEAQAHLTSATTMYCEMDMQFWLEQAEAEMRKVA